MSRCDVLIVGAGPVARGWQFALRRHGCGFTLLRFDAAVDVTALELAARLRNTPLRILDVEQPYPAICYGGALVLSRPDQHVAWRSDRLPADALALTDRIRGAAN